MGRSGILDLYFLFRILVFSVCVCVVYSQEEEASQMYTISSFTYARTSIRPYEWRYIKVDLPSWFSSMTLALESDVNDIKIVGNDSGNSVPMICFREGSPPLPDVYIPLTGLVAGYISNDSFLGTQSLQNADKCYPMQKQIFLKLTNEQISPGTWYFGLFNGIGPVRTQSKMINRGSLYSFHGNISVEGCSMSSMQGPFCNQSVNSLSCSGIDNILSTKLNNVIACQNAKGIICHVNYSPQVYSLDVMGIVEELVVTVSNVTFSRLQLMRNCSLMCFARHEAVPVNTLYDFSGDIAKGPLVIKLPKSGQWYITVQLVDFSNTSDTVQSRNFTSCYMLQCLVNQCPPDKAGSNCTFQRYMLQTVLRRNPAVPFESHYVPISGNLSSISPTHPEFPVEPFLSNYTEGNSTDSWTFFVMDIPYGSAGGNIHLRVSSDEKINYEVYARYGGLPSLDRFDYFYANSSSSSNGSMYFKLYDSKEKQISFYLLLVRAGTWSFGLRKSNNSMPTSQASIALSLERCPRKCSDHGTCQSAVDVSGLMLYSYCTCDRNHGGFDCSVKLVSHQGHIQQSIFLIASNAAAILPAYWALRNKAFAEWVLFTCSGIASALYHACDVGTWCMLSFHVLQFLDFWLSFMAVVSTFVYLSTISESAKRTIHTIVAILTALLAETGPTRAKNIAYVLGIGALALVIGLCIEFTTHNGWFLFTSNFHLNLPERWEAMKQWICRIFKMILKRFHWGFIAAGFLLLGMAAVSWEMEKSESYWIWHSLWHIFIYSSSFFFLCSKVNAGNDGDETVSNVAGYELTR